MAIVQDGRWEKLLGEDLAALAYAEEDVGAGVAAEEGAGAVGLGEVGEGGEVVFFWDLEVDGAAVVEIVCGEEDGGGEGLFLKGVCPGAEEGCGAGGVVLRLGLRLRLG